MDIRSTVEETARKAKAASRIMAALTARIKNDALLRMADAIEENKTLLQAENKKDLVAAESGGLSRAAVDRLTLSDKVIREMAQGLREVAALPDPVGEIVKMWRRPNGMRVGKMRVPIGLIGVIYESRPNVTADSASLCLKSGNGILLRGGSEAIHSNRAIVRVIQTAGREAGIPDGGISFIDTIDRQAVSEMLTLSGIIDLIIPRGGDGLMRMVTENSRIPVIKHDKGICHTYVDEDADLAMAEAICANAKIQRPGTCNAMETLLVHRTIAPAFLPKMIDRLRKAGVEIRGCPETQTLAPGVRPATEEDWGTEYLDLILAVRIVKDMDEAMDHMARYGSQHSEAIVTQNHSRAMRFLNEVDASAVFVNASTRLNDGFQFGLGAEIGISTTRIHARGPMGLEDLTSMKYIVLGDGQLRE